MFHKNKQQFAQKRFVYFAEVQQFNEGEMAEVKKAQGEERAELKVEDLVQKVNGSIDKHASQVADLPKEYGNALHDEIKKCLEGSTGQFDKDDVKGLNTAEFTAYMEAMKTKAEAIMKMWRRSPDDTQGQKSGNDKSASA